MDLLLAATEGEGGGNNIWLWIGIGVGGAIALFLLIYGMVRGFSRVSWIGWELLIVFGLLLLIPAVNIVVSSLLLVAVCALPLVGEHFLRKAIEVAELHEAGGAAKFFDHFFGVFTVFINFAMFFVALGGIALAVMGTFFAEMSFLQSVPAFVMEHALDFFLAALCFVVMRGGCRLGVLKGLNYLLTVALTFGVFFASFLLFSQVDWGRSFSVTVGGWFGYNGTLAGIIGCICVTFVCASILFVGVMFLSRFLDGRIAKANENAAVAIPDGLILGAVYTVAFIMVILGVQALFGALAGGDFLGSIVGGMDLGIEGLGEQISQIDGTIASIGTKLADFAKSSPLSCGLYLGNPFIGA